ncbi:6f7bf864-1cbe-4e8d-b67f-38fa8d54ed51 [Sclerotinia trifoliorum]|uniref:COP9 signalosome complex subunit 1 n=1 Tax=Sclerotinia trifoliorum TaxID=28548 RepID=A0A8H2W6U9_9HELO|nr:6f7bf864-1cbe-4e8d-b67f-38fa8d54ed51 [Sclerotinia trifoliorum]
MTSMYPPISPTMSRKKALVVTDPPKFDLESYISNYRGRTRLERLYLIGVTSTFLGVEALKILIKEAKQGKDVTIYMDACAALTKIAPNEPEAFRDDQWIDATNKSNAAEAARLEAQLKGYKNNLIKESTRMGNEDLGKHYEATGQLALAFDAYSRMRQDISIPRHVIDVCKHIIEVSIERKEYIAVLSNVQKMRGTSIGPDDDQVIKPFCHVAEGIAQMHAGQYAMAAQTFLQVPPGVAGNYYTIVSANDVAVYGGLCALATIERNDLQKSVLENSDFRAYLELEPHIRRAIQAFVGSKYSTCLEILESYKADYLLDIHLQKHVDELYTRVRSKSIVQYFIPFSCVTFETLNKNFAPPGKTIEKELAEMIKCGELDARIDLVAKTLISTPKATRQEIQQEALKTAKQVEREARQHLLRMNIIASDMEVRASRESGRRGIGGGMTGELFGGV